MSDILKEKTIVVTGAPSGIGRAIAVTAARSGAKAVIVSDITALWLSSIASSYLFGHMLAVDGGMTIGGFEL
jgi:NAD(P)-dependent dehydrogenase (short-subunit alcohol dehydrogenase family)